MEGEGFATLVLKTKQLSHTAMYSPSIKFQLPLCPYLTCVLLPAEKNRLFLKLQMLGIENRTLIHSKTLKGRVFPLNLTVQRIF